MEPSEVKAISPLVDRLMRIIEVSHCITGEEHAVELALREALSNAVVHGNRLDAKLAMNEVSFEQRGAEVLMCKRLARNPRAGLQSDSCGS